MTYIDAIGFRDQRIQPLCHASLTICLPVLEIAPLDHFCTPPQELSETVDYISHSLGGSKREKV